MAVMEMITYYLNWVGKHTGSSMVEVWGHKWGDIGLVLIDDVRLWGFVHLPTHMVIGRKGLWYGLTRLEDAVAAAEFLNAIPGIDSHNPSEDTRCQARDIAVAWLEADGNPEGEHDALDVGRS